MVYRDKLGYTNGCERLECHGLAVLCSSYLQEVVFENIPSDHEIWSIRCHVGIQAHYTTILHSHAPLVPQA